MDQFALRSWLDHWSQCVQLADDNLSQSMYSDLVEPFRKADPVFSSNVSKELLSSPYSDYASQILGASSNSKKRVMMCEIIFNICKCTNHECRLFVASQLPSLLWTEWTLDRQNRLLEEDLSAIEVALLAAFQQDLNIESSIPELRIPDIKNQSSIYHLAPKDTEVPNRFPYSIGADAIIKPDPAMYPSRPVTKIDGYSRPIVFYRLCRFLQNNLPNLPGSTKIAYCLLMEKIATVGTRLENNDTMQCLKTMAQASSFTANQAEEDNPSLLSLVQFELQESSLADNPVHVTEVVQPVPADTENVEFEWIIKLFDMKLYEEQGRRFPPSAPLYLLWADALVAISFQFPNLVKSVKKQLLRRSRLEVIPLAVIALSS